MSVIVKTFRIDGNLTDMTAVKLSSQDGSYGVKRNDTGAVVVVDGVSMTKTSTGVYQYEFTDPAEGLTYTYSLEVTYGEETYWITETMTGPTGSSTSNIKIDLYYDHSKGREVSSPIGGNILLPKLAYGDHRTVNVTIYSSGSTVIDLSIVDNWKASLDTDQSEDTDPLVRVLDADFIKTQVAFGIISFPITCNTTSFYEEVTETIKGFLEIYGYDSNDKQIIRVRFRVELLPAVDPIGDTSIDVIPGAVRSLNGLTGATLLIDGDGAEFPVINNEIHIPVKEYYEDVKFIDDQENKWRWVVDNSYLVPQKFEDELWTTYSFQPIIVVASATSKNKHLADYVCDGVDDHIEINAALQAAKATTSKYGEVKLLEGQFNVGAPIIMDSQKIGLSGSGCKGSLIQLQSNSDCNVLEVSTNEVAAQVFFNIHNLNINGNASQNASGWGIYVEENDLIKDVHISDVSVSNTKDGGIYIGAAWGHVAENVVSEFSLGIGYQIDRDNGLEAKLSNVKIMANAGTQFVISGNTVNDFASVKVVNGRFVAAANSTRVIDVSSTGNQFTNCDVSNGGYTGVTLIYCAGGRNQFVNMLLLGSADTVAVHFPSGANGNIVQAMTSFAISDPSRITVTNSGNHNRIILPRRGAGFTWVDSGARLDAPFIGDGTDKTINMLFDNGASNKPGIRYNHTTGTMQVSHNGTTWFDLPTS